jgi:hypothetical protein
MAAWARLMAPATDHHTAWVRRMAPATARDSVDTDLTEEWAAWEACTALDMEATARTEAWGDTEDTEVWVADPWVRTVWQEVPRPHSS